MPITYDLLKGLSANDRTPEEKKAIDDVMGRDSTSTDILSPKQTDADSIPTYGNAALIQEATEQYLDTLDEAYQKLLEDKREQFGVGRESINSAANEYLEKISNEASSYYKKFKDTDKLPLDEQEKKELAAAYDARKELYGEQNADIWLDKYYKNKVGENQSWWEQMIHGISHLIPAIEGGAIQAVGNLYGALKPITPLGLAVDALGIKDGTDNNPNLGLWDNYIDNILDNSITRYGRDVESSGTSHISDLLKVVGMSDQTANEAIEARKATATKYNPEGLGNDVVVTTDEQDQSYFNSTTPWTALQSGGFTALSMMAGAAEAKAAGWIFGKAAKGLNWLNSTGRALKTAESLDRGLKTLKKVQNFTDLAVIPGAVGTMEGAMEGLNTKIEVERDAVKALDDFYKDKVLTEAKELYDNQEYNPWIEVPTEEGMGLARVMSEGEIQQQVAEKYKDEYEEARRQIDWASSKAGIHNFYTNSLINGMMNTTLKAGLMAPRVQETLRNSRLTGWAYREPKFRVDAEGIAHPVINKLESVLQVLKEPFGEGVEEYLQSLSSDTFSGAAENNINEFIKAKFSPDGAVKVGDTFASDYAAALTAFKESLVSKESIESAILGAVSSTMGTVGGMGRNYRRDENGNFVQNDFFSKENWELGLNSKGEQETQMDRLRRLAPWRSGAINAYFDRKDEITEAKETAEALTEWLKDPQNRAKWDGLTGTAEWVTNMQHSAETNDQFSYRKSQMGKAINDVFMLSKLKGTDFYETTIADLQRASAGEISADDIQKLRQNGGDEYLGKSDEEIAEKIQSNANKMLGLITTVEQEGRNIDRLVGRIDEDTKQSLIFGEIMKDDFTERKEQLQKEIDTIRGRIQSSRGTSNAVIDDNLKALILKYGSLNQALKAEEQTQQQLEKAKQKVKELEAIDSDILSDKQQQSLTQSKQEVKRLEKQLEGFDALYKRDENGVKTKEVDSSLAQLVLNEEEVMALDTNTRAMVIAQGANKLYNATHQDRQKIEQINSELDEIQRQIDSYETQKQQWIKQGRVRKHYNKKVQRNNKAIEELEKKKNSKMRELNAVQGNLDSKPIYNSAQQEVIDNLVQQGTAQDPDFIDKVVDIARLEQGIKSYYTQYQAILSDPNAFQKYVKRAKYNAQVALTRSRASRVAGIQDFKEYSQELDRLTANASEGEKRAILQTLMGEDAKQKKSMLEERGLNGAVVVEGTLPKTNFDKYMENSKQQHDMLRQFAKNPDLTDNDQSLLLDAMQYLSSNGVDMTNREAAVQALLERDEEGNMGGKFRQYVEAKNAYRAKEQRTFMPYWTSIGQVVNQYVEILNGATADKVAEGNLNPTITDENPNPDEPQQPTVTISPDPNSPILPEEQQPNPVPQGPSLFDVGGTTPESGHFVDGDGTVATGTQTQVMQERQQQNDAPSKTALQELFEQVSTPEIAFMVDTASGVIINSNESEEVKELATQFLTDLAVNNNERLSTIDDVLTGIQEQINRLKGMSNNQEEGDNIYNKAAGLLQKVYSSLNNKKLRGKQRTAPMPSSRETNPTAGWIMSANLYWIAQKNPDAWAVHFADEHQIEEKAAEFYNNGTITTDTPIFFITDSAWTAEVTRQMTPTEEMLSINPNERKYDTLTDMPVVAAIRVDAPLDPAKTTAIEVDGLWYQPIAIMPSSKSKNQGAQRTSAIRSLASKEQGRHLITENGLPNGNPLITRVNGVNWLRAHHPDTSSQTKRDNTSSNNTNMIEGIINDLPIESQDRLRSLSKEEMLNDKEYTDARSKVLDGLGWGEVAGWPENLSYTPSNLKTGEKGNPSLVFTIPMSETTGRTDSRTLPEILENGTNEELRNFNSRTQNLYDKVIRPIFQFIQTQDYYGDKSAQVITQADLNADADAYSKEAERITKLLNGYADKVPGVSDYIYVNGWSFLVTAPEALQVASDRQTSQTVFKVFLTNDSDPTVAPIELGIIRAGQKDTDAAFDLLRNLLWDKEAKQVRDFLKWQVPRRDAQNFKNPDEKTSRKAKEAYGNIIDDGILEFAGSSLGYDVDGVELKAPISLDGRILYTPTQVSNPSNAQPASPINVTPQAAGAVVTPQGQNVEPDSGAILGNTPPESPQKDSAKLTKAKELTKKIIANSKEFKLSKDETYYYITDKSTGEKVKYLRVTTVIEADESTPQWQPTTEDVLNKLRERHSISDNAPTLYKNTQDMSTQLGIPVLDIKRAIAELRTEHKHTKYGAWGTPSTAIGNTVDKITRDFFNGDFYQVYKSTRPDGTEYYSANSRHSSQESNEHKLELIYPNATRESIAKFVYQLALFKADLDAQGIHIVPNGIVAHGTITMTDSEGNTRDTKVAGTLDLFGYDDNGNFYIFDMKTTRDHSTGKLENEKAKWSRQISMYADLLKQSYPDFNINADNLRIIPINVDYPTPKGRKSDRLDPMGPVYSVDNRGQLRMEQEKKQTDFKESNPEMRTTEVNSQFRPGYTRFNVNWDNLSSEDQDIADALTTQTADLSTSAEQSPQNATIETPAPERPSFVSDLTFLSDGMESTQAAGHQAPPVTPSGTTSVLPSWQNLTSGQKEILKDVYGIEYFEDYNDLLNDPATAEGIAQDLRCKGLL